MIIGIYGYQDAGKTKLVEDLVRVLVKKGYSVSSIKHSPHKKSIDCEGKDTWRHWMAGSDPVVFSSEIETSIIKHSKMGISEVTNLIMSEFEPDVLIVEGFKEGTFPKVAIGAVKPRKGTVMTNPKLSELVDYISNEVEVERVVAELPGLDCGKCGVDCQGLARAIVAGKMKLTHCSELPSLDVRISVEGKPIATGKFVSNIVNDTIRGMLSSLKGYEHGKAIEIRLGAKRETPKRHKS